MKITHCKLKKKVQKELLRFFVLEVTARSAADILGIHPNSAALLYRKIRIVGRRHLILATDKIWGCTRLALNSTPIPQDFKLLRRCAEVKPKFTFFQEQREGFAIDSVVFAQDAFCLIPKVLNAVNVVLTICKFLGMVDAVMDETAHV